MSVKDPNLLRICGVLKPTAESPSMDQLRWRVGDDVGDAVGLALGLALGELLGLVEHVPYPGVGALLGRGVGRFEGARVGA